MIYTLSVSELNILKDKSGGGVGNNGKLTKPLKYLVNSNGIFEYNTQLAPLDAQYAAKMLSHKTWCLDSGEDLILQKNLKGKWFFCMGLRYPHHMEPMKVW